MANRMETQHEQRKTGPICTIFLDLYRASARTGAGAQIRAGCWRRATTIQRAASAGRNRKAVTVSRDRTKAGRNAEIASTGQGPFTQSTRSKDSSQGQSSIGGQEAIGSSKGSGREDASKGGAGQSCSEACDKTGSQGSTFKDRYGKDRYGKDRSGKTCRSEGSSRKAGGREEARCQARRQGEAQGVKIAPRDNKVWSQRKRPLQVAAAAFGLSRRPDPGAVNDQRE